MTSETVAALLASPVLGAAAAKLWQWWTTRDAAKLALEAADAKARHDREAAAQVTSAAERGDIVALLQQQLAAGDERAEKSVARAEAIASALAENASSMRENSRALDELRAAIAAHGDEELTVMRDAHAMLRSLTGTTTGEHPRATVPPGALRAPTPPPPRRPT